MYYHVLNRGVDRRKIFLDNQDYFRFIHDLFEFNDVDRANTTFYTFYKSNDIGSRKMEHKKRKKVVLIYAFCLMPTHFHLLLSPLAEDGITKFMHKVGMGYAKYFNQKYKRKGVLFEGRYKSILVEQEAHFIHLPYYLHCNPLDLKYSEWRERKISNYREVLGFLELYRWSSHLDYTGKKNFPSVTDREFLLDYFEGFEGYKNKIYSWLKTMDLGNISDVVLE